MKGNEKAKNMGATESAETEEITTISSSSFTVFFVPDSHALGAAEEGLAPNLWYASFFAPQVGQPGTKISEAVEMIERGSLGRINELAREVIIRCPPAVMKPDMGTCKVVAVTVMQNGTRITLPKASCDAFREMIEGKGSVEERTKIFLDKAYALQTGPEGTDPSSQSQHVQSTTIFIDTEFFRVDNLEKLNEVASF